MGARFAALALTLLLGCRPAAAAEELTGWWRIVDHVESTSYAAFHRLEIEFRVRLRQEGAWVFGDGHKTHENGRALPPSQRTPIVLVGSVGDGLVTASIVESGRRRVTQGWFTWEVARDARRMVGSFTTSAAESSGSSTAERLPPTED